MRLFILNKNRAQVADLNLPNGPVPRAGEEIALPTYAADCDGMSQFLVTEVVWVLQGGALVAEVECQAMDPAHWRLHTLRDHGWLPPDPTEAAHANRKRAS